MVLQIPASIYEEMVAHARRELPNECVGMLIGSREGVVHEYLPLVNEQPSPVTFLTEPRSMLYAEKRCRALGLHVLGIFHSHPTGNNTASQRDLANHYSPDVLCLILAMEKEPPELAAWQMKPETFKRAEMVIVHTQESNERLTVETSWWLDWGALPDCHIWARLQVAKDGAAVVFDVDGVYHRFPDRQAALLWLNEDEYSLLAHLAENGEVGLDVCPPVAASDQD